MKAHRLQLILDRHTDPWGIKVSSVEMQKPMPRQAEAEREKRGKIIHAQGESQVASRLARTADVMSGNAMTLPLRYLETRTEIAGEKNSTIPFPIPINFLEVFGGLVRPGGREEVKPHTSKEEA